MKFGMGQPVARVEDKRFLSGRGRYTDDIAIPGQACSLVLRSPHAHARILSIDTTEAKALPGVLAVYTGADWAASGLGNLPCIALKMAPFTRADGSPAVEPPRPALMSDKVRFVGDYVAFIVADTLNQARDAAELVDIDYEGLSAVADTGAVGVDVPVVWDDCPDNVCFVRKLGDKDKNDAAFRAADHVISFDLPITRVAQNPMEPRAATGVYDPLEDRYTLYSGTQQPHGTRNKLAELVMKIPIGKLRVVSPDMGGGFGLRGGVFPEQALVLWAAKQLGRPVNWVADRSDHLLADDQGRDSRVHVELAVKNDGKFLGLKVKTRSALGAYLSSMGPLPTFGNLPGVAGVYTTPSIYAEVSGVYTNTVPTGPYRGAGRPEAAMMIELAVDRAARHLGMDRIEIRRRNMIPSDAMPYQTGLSFVYDSGEFETVMDKTLVVADVDGFAERRAVSERAGKLRGLGIAYVIEQSAGVFDEGADLRFDADGGCTVRMGTHSHGQGHETVFRQLLADRLNLDFEKVRYIQGDTDLVPYGNGSFGSRSSGLGGGALAGAADKIIEQGKRIAAHHLETAIDDIVFEVGNFTVAGTDKILTLDQVARIAHNPAQLPPGSETGLAAFATFAHKAPTFPNGCHICEVEIDPETGVLVIDRYSVVDDVGTVMNPMLLKGQIHGGIVQGVSQIVFEQMVWDEDGQPITGTFMDYCMPRADDVPNFSVESHVVPSPTNPLGIKGAGEAGTVGGMPCLTLAIEDALHPLGIESIEMPATPEKLWRAINEAQTA